MACRFEVKLPSYEFIHFDFALLKHLRILDLKGYIAERQLKAGLGSINVDRMRLIHQDKELSNDYSSVIDYFDYDQVYSIEIVLKFNHDTLDRLEKSSFLHIADYNDNTMGGNTTATMKSTGITSLMDSTGFRGNNMNKREYEIGLDSTSKFTSQFYEYTHFLKEADCYPRHNSLNIPCDSTFELIFKSTTHGCSLCLPALLQHQIWTPRVDSLPAPYFSETMKDVQQIEAKSGDMLAHFNHDYTAAHARGYECWNTSHKPLEKVLLLKAFKDAGRDRCSHLQEMSTYETPYHTFELHQHGESMDLTALWKSQALTAAMALQPVEEEAEKDTPAKKKKKKKRRAKNGNKKGAKPWDVRSKKSAKKKEKKKQIDKKGLIEMENDNAGNSDEDEDEASEKGSDISVTPNTVEGDEGEGVDNEDANDNDEKDERSENSAVDKGGSISSEEHAPNDEQEEDEDDDDEEEEEGGSDEDSAGSAIEKELVDSSAIDPSQPLQATSTASPERDTDSPHTVISTSETSQFSFSTQPGHSINQLKKAQKRTNDPDIILDACRYSWRGINAGYIGGDDKSWQRYTREIPIQCHISIEPHNSSSVSGEQVHNNEDEEEGVDAVGGELRATEATLMKLVQPFHYLNLAMENDDDDTRGVKNHLSGLLADAKRIEKEIDVHNESIKSRRNAKNSGNTNDETVGRDSMNNDENEDYVNVPILGDGKSSLFPLRAHINKNGQGSKEEKAVLHAPSDTMDLDCMNSNDNSLEIKDNKEGNRSSSIDPKGRQNMMKDAWGNLHHTPKDDFTPALDQSQNDWKHYQGPPPNYNRLDTNQSFEISDEVHIQSEANQEYCVKIRPSEPLEPNTEYFLVLCNSVPVVPTGSELSHVTSFITAGLVCEDKIIRFTTAAASEMEKKGNEGPNGDGSKKWWQSNVVTDAMMKEQQKDAEFDYLTIDWEALRGQIPLGQEKTTTRWKL